MRTRTPVRVPLVSPVRTTVLIVEGIDAIDVAVVWPAQVPVAVVHVRNDASVARSMITA